MSQVYLGNIQGDNETVTYVDIPDDVDLLDAFRTVVDLWPYHGDGDAKPSWAAADNPTLEGLLTEQFGCDAKAVDDAAEQYQDAVSGDLVSVKRPKATAKKRKGARR